jgi:hypothetical protein
MLSSQEYYDKGGDTQEGFAQTLFRDITGRAPTPQEFNWMMGQLGFSVSGWPRATLALSLLQRYPQALYPPVGPVPVRSLLPAGAIVNGTSTNTVGPTGAIGIERLEKIL